MSSFSEQSSAGKSGSFFYFSNDGKYILKTIKHFEKQFLIKILKNYYYHLKENPDSYIAKIFGLHRIAFKLKKGYSWKTTRFIYFIIMNNSFNTHLNIDVSYDLKGSLYKRIVNSKEK